MKVRDGTTFIIAKVCDSIVVVQIKVSDGVKNVQMQVVNSLTQAWAIVKPYATPAFNRVDALYNRILSHVQYFAVSVKDGIISARGTIGDRFVALQATIMEVVGALSVKISATKQGIMDLTAKIAAFVSKAYGSAISKLQILYTSVKDKFLYVACKINDQVVVLRFKASELIECVRTKSLQMYNSTLDVLTDAYGNTKVQFAHSTEVTKAKVIEAHANIKSFLADPHAKATAASAAGGAVVFGAGGAAAGVVAGGVTGAACALPFAFFTFGLSIPVGASIGAGAGLCAGTVAGGSAGLIAGGAAHKNKDAIGNGLDRAVSKTKAYTTLAKAKAMKVIGHTGGTAFA
jgi:hypothetical protein